MNYSKIVNIMGKPIQLKCNSCENENDSYDYPTANLYIKLNEKCNAKCKFCNSTEACDKTFNTDKLEEIIKELSRTKVLNRIAVTGGEPSLQMQLLDNVLNIVATYCADNLITINTNGHKLMDMLQLDSINKLYGIHVSRHHYTDSINDKIFGSNSVAHERDLQEFMSKAPSKTLLRLNCNLIDSYIDSWAGIKAYLEHAAKIGVFRVGFVSLMKVNKYCEEHYIDYEDILDYSDDSIVDEGNAHDRNICKCSNIFYIGNAGFVEAYFRHVNLVKVDYCRQLTYDGQYLNTGFNGEVVY